jgi:hypothetical protein
MNTFIKCLENNNYSYKIENGYITVNHDGSVYLNSLKKIKYQNKIIDLLKIDSFTMLIHRVTKKDEYTIYNCSFFKGGDIKEFKKVFAAKKGEFYSHGESIKNCIEDVNFKYLSKDFNCRKLVLDIKEKQTINGTEYRLLTGACRLGVSGFLKDKNISFDDNIDLKKALNMIYGAFGSARIYELFGGNKTQKPIY